MSKVRDVLDAEVEAEETGAWKCRDCSRPTESEGLPYCLHCRLYREDVANGLFDCE